MIEYIGILLESENSFQHEYFNQHITEYIHYFYSYDQFLMSYDSSCCALLIPIHHPNIKEIIHETDNHQIQLYCYEFTNSLCTFFKIEKTELSSISQNLTTNVLYLQKRKQHIRILIHEILYIESNKNYIQIHTLYKTYRLRMRIQDLSNSLDATYFLRCHQSYIVNMRYIRSMKRYEIVLYNNIKIPISKTYTKQTRAKYLELCTTE